MKNAKKNEFLDFYAFFKNAMHGIPVMGFEFRIFMVFVGIINSRFKQCRISSKISIFTFPFSVESIKHNRSFEEFRFRRQKNRRKSYFSLFVSWMCGPMSFVVNELCV